MRGYGRHNTRDLAQLLGAKGRQRLRLQRPGTATAVRAGQPADYAATFPAAVAQSTPGVRAQWNGGAMGLNAG